MSDQPPVNLKIIEQISTPQSPAPVNQARLAKYMATAAALMTAAVTIAPQVLPVLTGFNKPWSQALAAVLVCVVSVAHAFKADPTKGNDAP